METPQETKQKDAPAVITHPPILYAATLFTGLFIDALHDWDIFPNFLQFMCGALIFMAGASLLNWSFATFKDAETNAPTNKPALKVVTDGPYKYLRNPIYAGLSACYAGICIFFDWPVALLLLAPLVYVMNEYVIAPEEKYLAGKFGEVYLDYKSSVKRWGKF